MAPESDLCFNAGILNCSESYNDSFCSFLPIDVLDWSCHRIIIPESEIGEIATLEITVGDCGESAHFGYAYIDGICEECTSSALGSIKIDSIQVCDSLATEICGDYTLPEICGEDWFLDSLYVIGHVLNRIEIDTVNKVFCIYFPDSLFITDTCFDIRIVAIFSNGSATLPEVLSNQIELCTEDVGTFIGEITIGDCNDNGTSNKLSDDYYYITVPIYNLIGNSWSLVQELDDPYPDETGIRQLETGSSSGTAQLGPFFIHEGSWTLTFSSNGCLFEVDITPLEYCGEDCDEGYNSVVVNNIECTTDLMTDIDTWSFDIMVPSGDGSSTVWIEVDGNGLLKTKGSTPHSYSGLTMKPECILVRLMVSQMAACIDSFYVCPPKPCGNDCDIEPIIEDIICVPGSPQTFNVQVNVDGVSGKYLCYKSQPANGGNPTLGSSLPTNQLITGFTDDIFLTIFLCDNINCNTNCIPTPGCFKTFYVPMPNYGCAASLTVSNDQVNHSESLIVYPNPSNGEVFAEVLSEFVEYIIVNVNGQVLKSGKLKKGKQKIDQMFPPGVYYMFNRDNLGNSSIFKLIKL